MRHDLIIKGYAEAIGCGFMYEQWQMANVRADKRSVKYPLCVMVAPAAGDFDLWKGSSVVDRPNVLLAFLTPVERHDYNSKENEPLVDAMKRKALQMLKRINEAGDYFPVGGNVHYQVIFHKLDKDLTGIAIDLTLNPANYECLPDVDA